MTTFFQTLCVAFGMFSAIPVPVFEWNAKNMRYALTALPLVGAVCGGALAAWIGLCRWLGLGGLLPAAGACALPVLITGGFHLDGLADVSDALASYGDQDRRQEILKDSHVGAFALIRVCTYFVLYLGLCSALAFTPRQLWLLGFGYMLERALGGFAITALPLAPHTGLARTFADAAHKRRVGWARGLTAGLLAALRVAGGLCTGLLMVLASVLCFFQLRRVAVRDFGGHSGDLGGWFIQRCELALLASLVLGQALAAKGVTGWF